MDDENNGAFFIILFTFVFGLLIGAVLIGIIADNKVQGLGNMVCEERGHGDFVKFDNGKKEIVCEPKEQTEKYDGGTIVVDHEGGG